MSDLTKRHTPAISREIPLGPSGFDERLIMGQTVETEDSVVVSREQVIEANPKLGVYVDYFIKDYRHTADEVNLKHIAALCARANRPIPADIVQPFIDLMMKEVQKTKVTRKRRAKGKRLSRADAWRRDQDIVRRVDELCLELGSTVEDSYETLATEFDITPAEVRRIYDVANEGTGASFDSRHIVKKYNAYATFAEAANGLRPIELP